MNADQHRYWARFFGVLCVLTLCLPLRGQELQPAPDTDLPSVDDLLNVPKSSTAKPDPKLIDRAIEEELSTEPFELAVEGMRDAASRLGAQEDAGIETQRVQEQVVKRLDMLISQMRRQQQRQKQQARKQDSGSQQGQKQGQQQQDQNTQPAGTESDPNSVNRQQVETQQLPDQPLAEVMEEWGKLPPRMREAMKNIGSEKFSSLYNELTRRYYQRLAEESQ